MESQGNCVEIVLEIRDKQSKRAGNLFFTKNDNYMAYQNT